MTTNQDAPAGDGHSDHSKTSLPHCVGKRRTAIDCLDHPWMVSLYCTDGYMCDDDPAMGLGNAMQCARINLRNFRTKSAARVPTYAVGSRERAHSDMVQTKPIPHRLHLHRSARKLGGPSRLSNQGISLVVRLPQDHNRYRLSLTPPPQLVSNPPTAQGRNLTSSTPTSFLYILCWKRTTTSTLPAYHGAYYLVRRCSTKYHPRRPMQLVRPYMASVMACSCPQWIRPGKCHYRLGEPGSGDGVWIRVGKRSHKKQQEGTTHMRLL